MIELHLPRLAGTPDAVGALLDDEQVPADLGGRGVVAFCREVLYMSASYGDELVRQTLVLRGADELLLVGAPSVVTERVTEAAARRDVKTAVRSASAVEALR